MDIWIAEADGSNPQQLTHGPGADQGSPSWSPDGRRIAFDSLGKDSHIHLWMIDADGGAPRRLTAEAGDQVVPTWSHDGRWIYYSWWQADTRDIWRMPADGGAPERLTHGAAGPFACESADGKSLLFQPKDADSPLMTMALAGGPARQLLPCVKNSAFGVGSRGVYYVPCDPNPDPPLYVLDPNTGRSARLGRLDGLSDRPLGLSVSPDGNTIIYPRQILSQRRPDVDRELQVNRRCLTRTTGRPRPTFNQQITNPKGWCPRDATPILIFAWTFRARAASIRHDPPTPNARSLRSGLGSTLLVNRVAFGTRRFRTARRGRATLIAIMAEIFAPMLMGARGRPKGEVGWQSIEGGPGGLGRDVLPKNPANRAATAPGAQRSLTHHICAESGATRGRLQMFLPFHMFRGINEGIRRSSCERRDRTEVRATIPLSSQALPHKAARLFSSIDARGE